MKLIVTDKSDNGTNVYEVISSGDRVLGHLYRVYDPWVTQFGKSPAYSWEFDPFPNGLNWKKFDSFKDAKQYILNMEAA